MADAVRPVRKMAAQIRENLAEWIAVYLILVGLAEAFGIWVLETDPSRVGNALYLMVLAPVVAAMHGWYRVRREGRFKRLAGGLEDSLVDAGLIKGLPVLFFENGLWAEQLVVTVDPSDASTEFGKPITQNRKPRVSVLVFRAAYDAGRRRVPVPRSQSGAAPMPRARSEVVDELPDSNADAGLGAALVQLNLLMEVPAGNLYMRQWKDDGRPHPDSPRWVCEYQVPFEDRFLHPDAIEREVVDIANVLDQVCLLCGRPSGPASPNADDFLAQP